MTPKYRIAISFGRQIEPKAVRRIDYAFRVYCAVYGLDIVEDDENFEGVRLCYGVPPQRDGDLQLAVGYVPRSPDVPAPVPTTVALDDHDFPRFHPCKENSIDWLGEVFEWISTADELSMSRLDPIDRIPFPQSVHGRYGLDPAVPYASLAMRGLNVEIRRLRNGDWRLEPSPPPGINGKCVIAATHDVDYLPISFVKTSKRFLKNIGINLLYGLDPKMASAALVSGLKAIVGGPPLYACLQTIIPKEKASGIESSFFFVCRRQHRRDPNYLIDHPRTLAQLEYLADSGMEIGIHGSYTSLASRGRLVEEYRRLAAVGYYPVGGRQHWLRYHDSLLFDELTRAGAWYDCTIGFSETNGFRSGASFPYPPYNFAAEAPFPLLELPMVLMDAAIYRSSRDPAVRRTNARGVLDAVRRFGWGGVSILWHDSVFHGGLFPNDVVELYWTLKSESDSWMSARRLIELTWPRFADAGLLPAYPPQEPEVT